MDQIYGEFIRAIDGDTIEIIVTRRRGGNAYDYRETERVRLRGRNAPEKGKPGAAAAQRALQQRLRGRNVRVKVHARDHYGRLIANVTKTPKQH